MIEPLWGAIIPELAAPSYSVANENQPILIPVAIWKERLPIKFSCLNVYPVKTKCPCRNKMSMSKQLNDRSYCSAQSCLRSNLPFVEFDILDGRAQRNVRRITCPVFLIGTASDCDLILIDPEFPTIHAYIFIAPQQVRLQYLGNGPKTRIGQQIVEHTSLYNGDVIRTGPVAFGVRIQWQKGAEPTIESQRRFHDATMVQAPINASHHDVKRLTHIRLRNSSPPSRYRL